MYIFGISKVMYGVNFVDTIIVRSTEKGTKTIREPSKSMKWAGEEFKNEQDRKLSKIKGLKIASVKGTSKIDLAELYTTSVTRLEGRTISTNKGTGLLKL